MNSITNDTNEELETTVNKIDQIIHESEINNKQWEKEDLRIMNWLIETFTEINKLI